MYRLHDNIPNIQHSPTHSCRRHSVLNLNIITPRTRKPVSLHGGRLTSISCQSILHAVFSCLYSEYCGPYISNQLRYILQVHTTLSTQLRISCQFDLRRSPNAVWTLRAVWPKDGGKIRATHRPISTTRNQLGIQFLILASNSENLFRNLS